MDAITPWEDDADPGAAPPARKDEPHLGPMVPATSNLFHYHDDGIERVQQSSPFSNLAVPASF